MPLGRACSSSSVRPSHQRSRSSRASSSACSTALCTAGTSARVPRSHGSGKSLFCIQSDLQSLNTVQQSGGRKPIAAEIAFNGLGRQVVRAFNTDELQGKATGGNWVKHHGGGRSCAPPSQRLNHGSNYISNH